MNTEAREPEQSLAYTMRKEIERLRAELDLADRAAEQSYRAMSAAISRCKSSVDEYLAHSEDWKQLRSAVFGDLDIPLATLGSFVRRRAAEALKDSTHD